MSVHYTTVRNVPATLDTFLNMMVGVMVTSSEGISALFVTFSPHVHFPVLSQHNTSLVRKTTTLFQYVLMA